MSEHSKMGSIGQLTARLQALSPTAGLREAFAALRLDEVAASTALAGSALDAAEVRALIERGRALGDHALEDYLMVRAYADAAAWGAARARRPEPLTLEDLRELHRRAVAGTAPAGDGGAWRTRNPPPLADGTVATPYWLVPFQAESLVGRLTLEEALPPARGLARAVARLHRLRPFGRANGRVARLVASMLAARRGLPPPVLDARARAAWRSALVAAGSGAIAPLEAVIERALRRALERLLDAAAAATDLRPLAALLAPGEAERFYKAAQRGALTVSRRGGRLYATEEAVRAYRARAPRLRGGVEEV